MSTSKDYNQDGQIAKSAHQAFEDLKGSSQSHDLGKMIGDIQEAQRDMTPRQYNEFLTDVNTEVAPYLPGFQIGGIMNAGDKLRVEIKHGEHSTYLAAGAEDEKQLESLTKFCARETVDGNMKTYTEGYGAEAKTTRVTPDNQGGTVVFKTGPKPSDNGITYMYANDDQLSFNGDGSGQSWNMDGHGGYKVHHWGRTPADNHDVVHRAGGGTTFTWADGHKLESYHDAAGRYIAEHSGNKDPKDNFIEIDGTIYRK